MNSGTASHLGGIRTAVAGNRLSRLYLALTTAVLVWAVIDRTVIPHADGTFSAVRPMLLTAPTSLLLLVLPVESPVVFTAVVALAAVVNAWLIAMIVRRARRSEQE